MNFIEYEQNRAPSEQRAEKRRKRSRVSATKFDDLPEELIVEVLSRLPVKSLLQFKTIDKSWDSFISDGKFMLCNNHRQREKLLFFLKHDNGYILSGSLGDYYGSVNNNQILAAQEVSNPFTGFCFLGSCKGLLFFGDNQNIHLWNPSTKYRRVVHHRYNLGQLYYTLLASGVIYDESVGDYKVVLVTRDIWKPKTILVLFSHLKSITWKNITINFPFKILRTDSATPVVNGNLHLVAEDHKGSKDDVLQSIIYFETKRNEFKSLPIPAEAGQNLIYGLGVIEECLCMVRAEGETREILVMKEYGVKESWTIMFTVLLGSNLDDDIGGGYSLIPVFLTKNGEVVMVENHKKVLIYNWKEKSLLLAINDLELPRSIQKLLPSCSLFGFTFVESLEDGNQGRPRRRKRNSKLGR